MKFGKIELEEFNVTKLPQKAASAWSAIETSGLVGASYKPILYLGKRVSKGVDHIFLAEETLIYAEPERHIVILAINEFEGEYKLVNESLEVII